MIATRSGGYEGIGFALPMNMAVRVYNDIIHDGHVTRGSIGIGWMPNTKPEALKAMGFDHGVIISDVHKDGPAEKAGIKVDDIVLGMDGKAVKDGDDLVGRIADMPVGTPCTLTVDRDGKKMDFKLVVAGSRESILGRPPRRRRSPKTCPPPIQRKERPKSPNWCQFGIGVRPLSEDEKALTTDKHGMAVTRVEPNSFAADIGMQEKDIITSIDRHPINSIDDVKKIQATLKPGDPVVFRVVRTVPGPGARRAARSQVQLLTGTLPD